MGQDGWAERTDSRREGPVMSYESVLRHSKYLWSACCEWQASRNGGRERERGGKVGENEMERI